VLPPPADAESGDVVLNFPTVGLEEDQIIPTFGLARRVPALLLKFSRRHGPGHISLTGTSVTVHEDNPRCCSLRGNRRRCGIRPGTEKDWPHHVGAPSAPL